MKDILMILAMFAVMIFGLPLLIKGLPEPSGAAVQENGAPVFPDTLNVYLSDTGEIRNMTAEEYLEGCLAAQIAVNYEPEALKAQAAASAAYALRLMDDLRGSGKMPDGADISDDSRTCQPYFTPEKREEMYGASYGTYAGNIRAAAEYGKTHIITYENEPIYAVYHAVSAGNTCPSEYIWGAAFPYLRASASEADREFINFECVNEMKYEEIRRALIAYDAGIEIPADPALWFTDINANEDGYVISAKIGKNTFSGGDLWRILGLRSTAFTVKYENGIFTFTTKGAGHGAGLSQYGADAMALSGSSAADILRHYYAGVNVPE